MRGVTSVRDVSDGECSPSGHEGLPRGDLPRENDGVGVLDVAQFLRPSQVLSMVSDRCMRS
jgi:hypothetical protein